MVAQHVHHEDALDLIQCLARSGSGHVLLDTQVREDFLCALDSYIDARYTTLARVDASQFRAVRQAREHRE